MTVKNPCLSGGALEIFLEPHLPPPTMRVVGVAPIAAALTDLAQRMGYAVESGPAEQARTSPDDAAVVVASHGHDEERVLTEALRSGVPYVALVASEVRGQAVRESLDLTDEQRARLQTPAGLEIGAETPEEIALAILAEIVSLRPEGEPGQVPRLSTIGMEARAERGPRADTPRAGAGRPLNRDRHRPGLRHGGGRQRGEHPPRAGWRSLLLLLRGLPRHLQRPGRSRWRGPLSGSSPGSCSPPGARGGSASPSSCSPMAPAPCSITRSGDRAGQRARSADRGARRQLGRGSPQGRSVGCRRGGEPGLWRRAAPRRSPRD